MTVYVDDAIHGYGRMIMCHMVSPDVEELHAMADQIGVARRWFQNPLTMRVSAPHYDIAKSKRALAIAAGAKAIDKYQMSVMSNVALNRFLADRHREGVGHPLDPLRLFRAYFSLDKIEAMETWLGEELGPKAILRSRELAWETAARKIREERIF